MFVHASHWPEGIEETLVFWELWLVSGRMLMSGRWVGTSYGEKKQFEKKLMSFLKMCIHQTMCMIIYLYIYTHWDAPLPSTRWHVVLFKPKYTKPSLYEGFGEVDLSSLSPLVTTPNSKSSWIWWQELETLLRRDPKISEVHRFVASCLCLNWWTVGIWGDGVRFLDLHYIFTYCRYIAVYIYILQGDKSLCFLGLVSTYQEHFGQQRIELGSSFYVASAGRSGFTLF